MEMKQLHAEPLTRAAFAPFGDVIEFSGSAEKFDINYGFASRFHDLAKVDVAESGGRPLISLVHSRHVECPFDIEELERHPLSSQAFIPLGDHPFLVIVAPAGPFDPARIKAFLAAPGQGINYARGTWHHYLLPLGADSSFIIVDRGGEEKNCDIERIEDGNRYQVLR